MSPFMTSDYGEVHKKKINTSGYVVEKIYDLRKCKTNYTANMNTAIFRIIGN